MMVSAMKKEAGMMMMKEVSGVSGRVKWSVKRESLCGVERGVPGIGLRASVAPLERDVFAVAKHALSPEAQLPLVMFASSHSEEVVGAPASDDETVLTYLLLTGQWSQESLTGLLQLHQVAILIPPATLPSRGSLIRDPRWPLRVSETLTRALGTRVTPPPAPSRGRGTLAVNVLTLSSSSSPTITISCRETGQASRHRSSPSLTMEVTTDA